MSPDNNPVLSKVMHNAFLEVNEEGTETAAAFAVYSGWVSALNPSFIANHPFLFFIRHNPTMSILFACRYCSPDDSKDDYSPEDDDSTKVDSDEDYSDSDNKNETKPQLWC